MSKVYCIVKTKDYIYIPIKAKRNPYNGRLAYLRQLPNFFGGTVDEVISTDTPRIIRWRLMETALCAELLEESQGTINMDEEFIGEQMKNGLLFETAVNQEDYSFYLLSIPQEVNFPSTNVLDLRAPSGRQEEREMDYIIQVPITDIIDRVIAAAVTEAEATNICHDPNPNPNVIDEFASKILSACSNIQHGYDNYFTDLLHRNPKLSKAWNDSETKKAFAILAAVLFLHLNGNPRFSSEGESRIQTE